MCVCAFIYERRREIVHQENIINGNRSRIWLGLTPVERGQAQGDEAPTSNSSRLSDRMSFPMGLWDAHGCSRFTEMDNARMVTVWKIEDRKSRSSGERERERGGGERKKREIRH